MKITLLDQFRSDIHTSSYKNTLPTKSYENIIYVFFARFTVHSWLKKYWWYVRNMGQYAHVLKG